MLDKIPGQNPIYGEWIDLLESLGQSKLASEWAEKLCKAGLYHHGARSAMGTIESGKPYKEDWSCWNCDFKVERTTTLVHKGGKKK